LPFSRRRRTIEASLTNSSYAFIIRIPTLNSETFVEC
jgi:hypothetical protein